MIKISQTISNTKRVSQIVSILYKNGFDDIIKRINFEGSFRLPLFKDTNKDNLSKSQRIKKTIEELGPTFIKLAQMLSTRPDLISLELVHEFEKLQDSVSPMHIDKITPIFKEEFGKEYQELFSKPLVLLATASIGQVYKTQLLSGNEVVIKVLKPKISETIKNDLDILKTIASMFDNSFADYGIMFLLFLLVKYFFCTLNGTIYRMMKHIQ